MKISQLLHERRPVFSFEFFPPQTPAGERSLFKTFDDLKSLEPAFVSVTSGAGGSTRRKTVEWARRIRDEVDIEPMVHMTCLGVDEQELQASFDELRSSGLENVLALRGDPPSDGSSPEGVYTFANQLVERLRAELPDITIAAACYPEVHAQADNRLSDLENLRKKAEAGTDFFITQLFFDNRHYFDFVGRARSMGITQPIIPGLMPIQNVAQIKRFTTMCGATLPASLTNLLDEYDGSPAAVFYIGVAHTIAQAQELLESGAPGVHFYTLNKSPATRLVVEALKKAGLG